MPDATLSVQVNAADETAIAELQVNGETIRGTRQLAATGHTVADPTAPPAETTLSLPTNLDPADVSVHPTFFDGGTGYGALVLFGDEKTLVEFDATTLGLAQTHTDA